MPSFIPSIINKLTLQPQKLFLADGLGAALTAIILATVVARYEDVFGIPQNIAYFLSGVAGILMIYSSCCYFFVSDNWRLFLKVIALANLIYCCLTIGMIFYFYQTLTPAGVTYFLLEIIVIGVLVINEWRIASARNPKK